MNTPELTSVFSHKGMAFTGIARTSIARTMLVSAALMAVPVLASTEAHVHRVAKLSIVQDATSLLVEFDSPLANLTGFEYKPRNMAEHTQLNQAIIKLKDVKRQFQFSGWNCDVKEIDVVRPWQDEPTQEAEGHEKHHEEEKHAHADEHAHEEKHAHDEKHGHHEAHEHDDEHKKHTNNHHDDHDDHDDQSSHSDLQVQYHFTCGNTGGSQGMKVQLFNDFPQIEEVEVEWLTVNGAGTAELTATKNQLKL